MVTSTTTYFGNRARAYVGVAGFTPALADKLAVTRGFEVNVTFENAELYGTDSIKRADQARHTLKIDASLKGCKFDPSTSGTANLMHILMHALSPTTGAITSSIEDTNTIQLFDVYIFFYGSANPTDNKVQIKVTSAYIEGVPIPLPENDYITMDLKFHGTDFSLVNNASEPVA